MRRQAYHLAEIVAWPAVAWGCVELGLRAISGYPTGAWDTLAMTICAAGTIVFVRKRRAALVAG